MKLRSLLVVAVIGAALALPSLSNAAPPTQNSVVLTDPPAVVPDSTFASTVFELNATSDPDGGNLSGVVRFDTLNGFFHMGGPVTCLDVKGNTATVGFADQMDWEGPVVVEVVDDHPDTWAFTPMPAGSPQGDCSPLFAGP
jgi:hypothetical protein